MLWISNFIKKNGYWQHSRKPYIPFFPVVVALSVPLVAAEVRWEALKYFGPSFL